MDGSTFLALYAVLFASAIALMVFVRHHLRTPHDDDGAESLQPYEHAYLAGGEARALAAAIASLHARGIVQVQTMGSVHTLWRAPHIEVETIDDALERAIVANATSLKLDHEASKTMRMLPELATLRERLERRALLLDDAGAFPVRAASAAIFLAVAAIGGLRIVHGLSVGAPVGFTFALATVALIVAGIAWSRGTIRTVRGESILARMNERTTAARDHERAREERHADRIARAVAAEGPNAVPNIALALGVFALGTGFNSDGASGGFGDGGDSGGGGGGDGGGGGGGGGCGGCGGCGG